MSVIRRTLVLPLIAAGLVLLAPAHQEAGANTAVRADAPVAAVAAPAPVVPGDLTWGA
ncbi:hypothetical protein P3T37_002314 [Kitasatospora sp. MAA4]|uniref:hypothetical protein n=1 Tax=Kitasatospora sp. MAA4 TaxID=3035093 RepID=UPI0024770DEF|nr:hypothetical protein [Kitasatospora sp. MAA4]MDH6132928.1 hypothetical protein [Kitasatospora sp. MAA4]